MHKISKHFPTNSKKQYLHIFNICGFPQLLAFTQPPLHVERPSSEPWHDVQDSSHAQCQKGQNQIQQLQPFSSFIDNPFLIAYEATNSLASNQIVGNLNATIQLTSNFNLLFIHKKNVGMFKTNRRFLNYFSKILFYWPKIPSNSFLKLSKRISFMAILRF